MNMKTTKFLAVLAVLAMAFAAFAVAIPAQDNDATDPVAPIETDQSTAAVAVPSTLEDNKEYYLDMSSATADVTLTGNSVGYTLYVLPGEKNLIIKDTGDTSKVITVYVAKAVGAGTGTTFYTDLKIVITTTGANTDSITLDLSFEGDAIGPKAVVKSVIGNILTTANCKYGMLVTTESSTVFTFYANGATVGTGINLENGDTAVIPVGKLGSFTINSVKTDETTAINSVELKAKTTDSTITVTCTDADGAMTISSSASESKVGITVIKSTKTSLSIPASSEAFTGIEEMNLVSNADLGTSNSEKILWDGSRGQMSSTGAYIYGKIDATATQGSNKSNAVTLINSTGTIKLTDKDGKTITLITKGANGTITASAAGKIDTLSTFTSGDLELSSGTFISPGITTTAEGDLIIGAGADVTFTGAVKLEEGQLYVKANAKAVFQNTLTLTKGDFTIEGKAKVTVAKAIEMTGNFLLRGTLTIEESMSLTGNGEVYGTIKGVQDDSKNITVNLGTNKTVLFKAYSGSSLVYIDVVKGVGDATKITIDLSGAVSTVYLHGTISTSVEYGQTQNVVVDGDLVIKDDAKVEINGSFQVMEGVTLDLADGRIIIAGDGVVVSIDGTVKIAEGSEITIGGDKEVKTVTVNGQIIDDGKLSIDAKDVTIAKGGSLTIAADADTADLANFTVAAGGLFQVNGKAIFTGITNKGTVILDGAIIMGNSVVNMAGNGATVDLKSFTINTSTNTLKITDTGADAGTKTKKNTSTITFSENIAAASISGPTIVKTTSTITISDVDYFYSTLTLSGKMEIDTSSEDTKNAKLTVKIESVTGLNADVKFADEFYIGPAVSVSNNGSNATVTIDDRMVIEGADGKTSSFNGYIIVNGVVACNTYASMNVNAGNISAAVFTLGTGSDAITYYASIEAAAELLALYPTSIIVTVYGEYLVVSEDVIIPAAMQIRGSGVITVGSVDNNGITMTVSSGATIGANNKLVVYASVYFENKNDLKTTDVISDVESSDGTDLLLTNLYTALATAEVGDTIEVTATSLSIEKNIVVPVGVTLYIPNGIGVTVKVENKITITVNGVMMCNGINAKFDEKATATTVALKVNGVFMDSHFTDAKADDKVNSAIEYYKGTSGVFYYISDEVGDYVYISPLSIAVESAAKKFTVSGDVVEALPVEMTKGESIIIPVGSTLNATMISLNEARIYVFGKLTATISGIFADDGTVVFKVTNLTVGAITNEYDKETGLYTTSIGAFTGDLNVISGILCIDTITISGTNNTLTVSDEAILYIPKDSVVGILGTAYIDGVISVAGDLIIDSEYAFLTGTISVVYDEDDAIDGTLEITKMSFISGSIVVADGATFELKDNFTVGIEPTELGADATIIGDVKTSKAIVAYPGADLSLMTINGKEPASTAFYINDELFMTVYSDATDPVKVADVIGIPEYDIPELDQTELGELKTDVTKWGATDRTKVGGLEGLYADIDYRAMIITASFAKGLSLYIDGVRVTISGQEVSMTVGIHYIEAKIDPGYACDNMQITFNGIAVPVTEKGTIVTIGVDDEGSVLAVSGDVYIPEPEPVTPEEKSEWTITTILLVILVILIAVMAVIVALRLNRS